MITVGIVPGDIIYCPDKNGCWLVLSWTKLEGKYHDYHVGTGTILLNDGSTAAWTLDRGGIFDDLQLIRDGEILCG